MLHGEPDVVAKDVTELGKVIGVKFKGDPNNSFNLLSREGRREWRAMGGYEVENVEVGAREDVEEGN